MAPLWNLNHSKFPANWKSTYLHSDQLWLFHNGLRSKMTDRFMTKYLSALTSNDLLKISWRDVKVFPFLWCFSSRVHSFELFKTQIFVKFRPWRKFWNFQFLNYLNKDLKYTIKSIKTRLAFRQDMTSRNLENCNYVWLRNNCSRY